MATLNLTITVPDDKAQAILDAFAAQYGYSDESGISKLQFMKRGVIEFVRNAYATQTVKNAEQEARQTALQEVNSVPIT